jgi:HEPN domain-containing protein
MAPDFAEAMRWLAFAEEDLEHGKLGAASFPRAAAWSFQQAAEKALKSLVLASGEPVPKVHDLAYLLQVLETKFPCGSELLDPVMDLAEVSTVSRYPGDMEEITTRDCFRYQVAAVTIVAWCKAQLDGLTDEGDG